MPGGHPEPTSRGQTGDQRWVRRPQRSRNAGSSNKPLRVPPRRDLLPIDSETRIAAPRSIRPRCRRRPPRLRSGSIFTTPAGSAPPRIVILRNSYRQDTVRTPGARDRRTGSAGGSSPSRLLGPASAGRPKDTAAMSPDRARFRRPAGPRPASRIPIPAVRPSGPGRRRLSRSAAVEPRVAVAHVFGGQPALFPIVSGAAWLSPHESLRGRHEKVSLWST